MSLVPKLYNDAKRTHIFDCFIKLPYAIDYIDSIDGNVKQSIMYNSKYVELECKQTLKCPLCGRNYNDFTHYRLHEFDRHFVQHFANDINLRLSYCQYAMVTVEKRQPGTLELRETLKGFVKFIDKKTHTELHLLTSIGKLHLLVNKFSVCNSKLYLIYPCITYVLYASSGIVDENDYVQHQIVKQDTSYRKIETVDNCDRKVESDYESIGVDLKYFKHFDEVISLFSKNVISQPADVNAIVDNLCKHSIITNLITMLINSTVSKCYKTIANYTTENYTNIPNVSVIKSEHNYTLPRTFIDLPKIGENMRITHGFKAKNYPQLNNLNKTCFTKISSLPVNQSSKRKFYQTFDVKYSSGKSIVTRPERLDALSVSKRARYIDDFFCR